MTYLVRTNCEYSIQVDADNEEHACDLAAQIPYGEWGQAWAPYEAEEEPTPIHRIDMPPDLHNAHLPNPPLSKS
jgi:hypothetical protein